MEDNNKLETISNLFEGKEIRSIWDSKKEEYYFSVVDVIGALTESKNPNDYWYRLKKRMTEEEKSELSTKCRQLKLQSNDGKFYLTDTLDTEGILRLIESVPSSKAEPFKLWLAQMGKERIDEIFDPEIAINRAIDYYRNKGYTDGWIEARLKGILDRKKLTDIWKENGINKNYEYAVLTNEIYKTWSGMRASEYKNYKNIRKESLRDNMTDVEVALTDLGEIATRELAKKHKPQGLKENKKIAKAGGEVAKSARDDLEQKLGETVVSKNNNLNYEYLEENKMLEDRNELVKKAGCILINPHFNTIALVKRKGKYSFPKGHLERNETTIDCALRETKEETRHDLHIIEDEPISIIYYTTKKGENVECYYYLAIDDGITNDFINDEDKEKTEWIHYKEVEEALSYQNLKDFWNEIKNEVKKVIDN